MRVLERLGHTVDFPAGQTCCGQMHYNTGYQARLCPSCSASSTVRTRRSRRRPILLLRRHDARSLSENGEPKSATPDLEAAVAQLLPRVFEFSEFLTDRLGLEDVGAYYPHRVTYHASCHGLRTLTSATARCAFSAKCAASNSSSFPHLEQCCGFGGTFAIKNADVSTAMLAEKTEPSSTRTRKSAQPAITAA